MSYDGNGNYSPPAPPVFPAVSGATIRADYFNTVVTDIAAGLTKAVTRDGQSPPTANLPMGGYKHTGLASGSARSDSVRVADVQDGVITTLTAVAGSNIITATSSPVTTTYSSGNNFRFVAAAANTGAVTININGLGALAITKSGATALEAGDIAAGAVVQIHHDGTQFQLVSGAGGGAKAGGTLYENKRVLNANYTLTANCSAHAVGPYTVPLGMNLTIPSGERFVIL